MNVSQAIWERLKSEVSTVFYLPGGGSGPLVDALGASGLRAVCCLHEQSAGYAAVGYAQYKGFGVCLVTSGPGVTNAMTPCLAAWLDSVPVLFISGQVMVKWLALPGMRSRGTQEGPTIEMVRPITKYVAQPQSAVEAMIELDNCITAAKEGRRGGAWLDIPMDVQAADV
ncbi:MAG TPA: thiamine pyrophosphate-binding protein [Anaerolineales bacterium]|nr:thiamine pyrophosphate-binding protein [Anaerolineales bacterium]